MIIYFTDDLRISAEDGMNFIIEKKRRKRKEDGEETKHGWAQVGYYSSFDKAAESILEKHLVSKEEEKTVQEFIVTLKEEGQKIRHVCEGVVTAVYASKLRGIYRQEKT
jgi:hypothetical protein